MRQLRNLVSLWLLLAAGQVWSADPLNLVQNPSFEQGEAFWSFTGNASVDTLHPELARTGVFEAFVNGVTHPPSGTISQAITTVPGGNYYVEIWIAQNGSASGHVVITFAGAPITDFQVGDVVVPVAPQYIKASGLVTATSSSSLLWISAETVDQTLFFEDASVSAVPEPASAMSMLAGLGLLGAVFGRLAAKRRPVEQRQQKSQ